MFSVFTSLAFSIIVTRNLSQTEFGLWGTLGSLIVYGMILDPIAGYWITRETARNENSQKTAMLFNQTLSFGGIIIFVIVIFLIGVNEKLDYEILLLIIFLIPIKYLLKILNTINFGWQPQNTSYGMFISEITKIIVGLILDSTFGSTWSPALWWCRVHMCTLNYSSGLCSTGGRYSEF